MFCILWFIDVFIKPKYKLNKPPKFRKSIDGNEDIEFYSEFYKEWKKFCIWNDYDKTICTSRYRRYTNFRRKD